MTKEQAFQAFIELHPEFYTEACEQAFYAGYIAATSQSQTETPKQ